MAKIIFKEKELEIPDNSSLKLAESLGIVFGCSSGLCGVCRNKVIKGMENLNPITENEELHSLTKDERLLCQCKINKGTVEISEP